MRATEAAIPRKRARFFGREAEIRAVREALDTGAPLVTVIGPAGAGKTSTALELVRPSRAHPDVALLFCELAEQRTDAGFVAAVARELGLYVTKPEADLREVVGARLAREGSLLVVLDNFEQLPDQSARTVDRWIATAQEAQFLVTSRAPLRLSGEVCVELPPLDVQDAVALFEDRARASGASTTELPRSAVEQLVRRLDGLPLAIELAAGRADLMTPEQMLAELGSRFDLLERDGAASPDRHASLRAAISWSWELVSDRERATLAQLSAFRGPFSVAAATRVVADREAEEIGEVLHALRRRSLLAGGSADGGRFRLLESVRDFAALELARTGAPAATWERHARWVADEVERRANRDSRAGASQRQATATLDALLDDALAAHARSSDAAVRIRLARGLHRFLEERGLTTFHLGLLDACVADAARLGDAGLEAEARLMRADLRSRSADIAGAEEEVAASLAILAGPEPARQVMALEIRIFCMLSRRDPQGALETAERAIAIETAHAAAPGPARYRRAIALAILGRVDEARRAGEESVVLYAQRGLPWLEADARLALAKIAHHAGDRTAALLQYRAAARLHRKLGDRRGLVSVALNLGSVLDDGARFALARLALGAAVTLAGEQGDPGQRAGAVVRLGLLDLQAGAPQAAEGRFAEVLATRDAAEDGARTSLAFLGLGVASAMRGDVAGAIGHMERAGETAGIAPTERVVTFAYAALVRARAGDRTTAGDHLARARRELPAGDQVRAMLLDLAEAALAPDEERTSRLGAVRARVSAAFPVSAPTELRIAELLVSLAGARPRRPSVSPARERADLTVEAEGRWFVRGSELVRLGRRRAARFVLAALVDARLTRSGAGLSAENVLACGWPGERVLYEAGQLRVRNVIRELRDLGLRDMLITQDDGYLLGPAVHVERAPGGSLPPPA